MRNRILFLLCFLCIGLQAFAQISISGKVVDAGGLELPGVNVMVKGTTIGTLTDGDGRFTFQMFRVAVMPYWYFLMSVSRHKK